MFPGRKVRYIYRGRLFEVDVPRLHMQSGQIAPTSPSAPSHSAWSSAPWGLLRCPRKPSNLLPLMGGGPARPDRPRKNNNNNNLHLFYMNRGNRFITYAASYDRWLLVYEVPDGHYYERGKNHKGKRPSEDVCPGRVVYDPPIYGRAPSEQWPYEESLLGKVISTAGGKTKHT